MADEVRQGGDNPRRLDHDRGEWLFRPQTGGASGWNLGAIVALVAGGVAALGAVLLWCGISPGFVSARESAFDKLENHVKYFGPLVLLSWCAVIFARPKRPVLVIAGMCTLLYLAGFLALK